MSPPPPWSLDQLDDAFASWIQSKQGNYDDNAVIRIVGAAFGERCAMGLDMVWIKVADMDGSDFAIRGREKGFRGWEGNCASRNGE